MKYYYIVPVGELVLDMIAETLKCTQNLPDDPKLIDERSESIRIVKDTTDDSEHAILKFNRKYPNTMGGHTRYTRDEILVELSDVKYEHNQ